MGAVPGLACTNSASFTHPSLRGVRWGVPWGVRWGAWWVVGAESPWPRAGRHGRGAAYLANPLVRASLCIVLALSALANTCRSRVLRYWPPPRPARSPTELYTEVWRFGWMAGGQHGSRVIACHPTPLANPPATAPRRPQHSLLGSICTHPLMLALWLSAGDAGQRSPTAMEVGAPALTSSGDQSAGSRRHRPAI